MKRENGELRCSFESQDYYLFSHFKLKVSEIFEIYMILLLGLFILGFVF